MPLRESSTLLAVLEGDGALASGLVTLPPRTKVLWWESPVSPSQLKRGHWDIGVSLQGLWGEYWLLDGECAKGYPRDGPGPGGWEWRAGPHSFWRSGHLQGFLLEERGV